MFVIRKLMLLRAAFGSRNVDHCLLKLLEEGVIQGKQTAVKNSKHDAVHVSHSGNEKRNMF